MGRIISGIACSSTTIETHSGMTGPDNYAWPILAPEPEILSAAQEVVYTAGASINTRTRKQRWTMTGTKIKPDFNDSMTRPWGRDKSVFSFRHERWRLLEGLYARWRWECSDRARIPKSIHQVWFGGPLPRQEQELANAIIRLNPDWTYTLWNDDDIGVFGEAVGKHLSRITNLGVRSDVFRYLVLEKFGGLYLDCDFVPVRPFDDLVGSVGFLAGVCNPDEDGTPLVNNGFVAACAGHPVLRHIREDLVSNLESLREIKRQDEVFTLTGPQYFTRIVFDFARLATSDDMVILPSTFMYPICYRDKYRIGKRRIDRAIAPETYAIHLWNASWFKADRSLRKQIILALPYRLVLRLQSARMWARKLWRM